MSKRVSAEEGERNNVRANVCNHSDRSHHPPLANAIKWFYSLLLFSKVAQNMLTTYGN